MDTFFDEHDEHKCLLSEEPINYWTFLFQGCILPILVLCGCINNLIILRILCKMRTKCATGIILKALAVSDILYLVSTVFTWMVYSWYEVLGEMCNYMHTFTLAIPFLMGFHETSCDIVVWVFVMLVIERYISMAYFVMKDKNCARHSLTAGTVVVAMSFLYATSFNIPALANYHIISDTVSENGSSVVLVPVGLSTMDNVGYSYYTLDCIINIFIPIAMVALMTAHSLFAIYCKGKEPEYIFTRGEDNEPKVDRGAFASSPVLVCGCLFIVCETPRVIGTSLVLSQLDIDPHVFKNILHICSVSFIMLQAGTSFIKLFVYCTVSDEFKAVVRSLYSSQRRHRHNDQSQRRFVGFPINARKLEEEQGMVDDSHAETDSTRV